jgi:hypothetical protein
LVRAESKSDALALSATALVAAMPLVWPLVWNDFRELQLALPFVLWAVRGWRGRRRALSAFGIAGMLACRQEYAVMVAMFGLIPPRESEDIGRTYLWAWTGMMVGLAWFLFAFFGYLVWKVGWRTPEAYMEQFGGTGAGLIETSKTALDFLLVGLGPWALLACFAPRIAVLALPWLWSLSSGRWALRLIATTQWHHVRYTAPLVAIALAAGLVGYARIGSWLLQRNRGRLVLVALWLACAVGSTAANHELQSRFSRIAYPLSREEAREVMRWVSAVQPDDGVLAVYEVTAPLSSRKILYSYVLDQNKPLGYPNLMSEIRWAFIRGNDVPPQVLYDQGFEQVRRGEFLAIYRRPRKP